MSYKNTIGLYTNACSPT